MLLSKTLGVLVVLVSYLCLFWAHGFAIAEPFDCTADRPLRFEVTEDTDRPRCAHFDPCRQPFFGTTHLHTGLSFDSSFRFVENRPDDAYMFARGKSSITLPNIIELQGVTLPGLDLPPDLRTPSIDRRTDWGGVTDHAEHFGKMGICKKLLADPDFPNPPDASPWIAGCSMDFTGTRWAHLLRHPSAFPSIYSSEPSPGTVLALTNNTPVSMNTKLPVCLNNPDECDAAELAGWGEQQRAAGDNYDRTSAVFTDFASGFSESSATRPASMPKTSYS